MRCRIAQAISVMIMVGLVFFTGYVVRAETRPVTYHHVYPVCIIVHANGAPAPASCSDPNSYQVFDGTNP